MAPWPEQGSEPKAPDRNKTSDNRTLDHSKSKSEPPEDKKSSTGILKDEDQSEAKKKDVHSLDDGQLKALLDEAIQYKCPKDREGKSKIFRELLQKVEADEIDCNYPVVGIRGSGSRRGLRGREGSKSVTVSERASRGGSLQNIFHASSSSEFDTHHTGGVRRKNKRQGPGSSVSARQREGGSLPSNVNAGWPLESWQSDQIRKKGLFDRDSQQQTHVPPSIGNTAYCNSSSVATASTQARRQTLMHSASNELPSSRKQSPGELYPLRRHHSSSDQSKATELTSVKLKSHSENSSTLRKMPQVSKPEYVSLDMGGLNLETKTLSDSDPALSFEKKLQTNHSERYRITPCEVESENQSSNNQEVFTSRASLEVEPVDSSIEFDLVNKAVNMMNGMEAVQLSENYQSVQCIVGDGTRISDASNQVRMSESAPRAHMYRPLNMISLVNISSKTTNDPPRTDENGNALNMSSLSSRNPNTKKRHKRKQLTEKNVVLSQNIEGYRGDKDVEDLLNFIESDKNKNKQLKKPLPKGNKKHEKKRQSIQKSSSLEEISQRNIDDLTESSESERLMNVRKPRLGSNDEAGTRERRSWGDQVYIRSGSQNDLTTEQMEENNSDSEFQMVTKKQRKRKVNEANTKRVRNHRSSRRSPRRKSTSSVPPSERSGDSDLDSVHSLPVGGAPAVSYADIAAGNTSFFTPKSNSEMSTFNKHDTGQVECASVVKNNEIEEWCNSVSQHMEKNTKINSNNNTNNNNNHQHHHNNGNNNNNVNNNNNKNNVNSNNNNNNNYNTSDSKNYTKHENRKQNLDIEENGICDNNIKKLKDLVIVDNSFVDSEVTSVSKVVEVPLKNDIRKNSSNCDVNQCKIVDNKNLETKNKNWNKKNFSREDFPSLPVKSENSSFNNQNKNNNKELGEHNASFAKTKQYSSLPDTEKHLNETKPDGNATNKPPVKPRSDDEIKHRRSNRSKSVGPNSRPAVILLHDNERMKDSSVCEFTFGFEVNEQLLTSDESSQLLEEDVEVIDETSSSSSKSSSKSGGNGFHKALKKGSDSTLNVDTANSNGGIVYNDVIENRNAYMNSSKAVVGEITNSTVQELFKRHETMSRIVPENKMMSNTSAGSIVNKYVPPNAPVQFNHDKIVTFVGMAWEDVMRNGRIQYYRGDN